MKKVVVIILIVTGLLLTACSAETTQAETLPLSAEPQTNVLIAEGRLLPANWIERSFSLSGEVAEVLVSDGESVMAGQLLARLAHSAEIDAAQARAQQELLAAQQALDELQSAAALKLAEAKLAVIAAQEAHDDAQTNFDADESDENRALLGKAAAHLKLAEDALEKLEGGDGVHPDQLAAAEARLAAAQAAVASSQAALDALELKASMDGTVVDLRLQPGQQVSAAGPALTVADFSSWVVETDNLTEAEVVDVKIGQPVSITLDALPDKTLSGEVTHINARFEEKRGDITYTVTVVLSQTDPAMRWGMTAAVQFLP